MKIRGRTPNLAPGERSRVIKPDGQISGPVVGVIAVVAAGVIFAGYSYLSSTEKANRERSAHIKANRSLSARVLNPNIFEFGPGVPFYHRPISAGTALETQQQRKQQHAYTVSEDKVVVAGEGVQEYRNPTTHHLWVGLDRKSGKPTSSNARLAATEWADWTAASHSATAVSKTNPAFKANNTIIQVHPVSRENGKAEPLSANIYVNLLPDGSLQNSVTSVALPYAATAIGLPTQQAAQLTDWLKYQ